MFGLCIAVYDEAGDYDIAELLPPFPTHIPVRIFHRPGRFMKAPVRHAQKPRRRGMAWPSLTRNSLVHFTFLFMQA